MSSKPSIKLSVLVGSTHSNQSFRHGRVATYCSPDRKLMTTEGNLQVCRHWSGTTTGLVNSRVAY